MQRRKFLKVSGAVAFGFSGLTTFVPRVANAAQLDVELIAEAATKTLVDNASVPVWRFRGVSANATGLGALSASLGARLGDTLSVTLTNNLDRPINFAVAGMLSNTPACDPGSSQVYTFTVDRAGSFLFFDELNGDTSKMMGLTGPMVVAPADGSARLMPDGALLDRQYTLMLSELDAGINRSGNGAGNIVDYEPNYYFVNGLSYPQVRSDLSTDLIMGQGEKVGIRLINGGLIFNSMHFHGYHVSVINRNRSVESAVINKDTVLVSPGECVDVIVDVNQVGDYPMHNHFLPAVTANGVYGNGAMLMMRAS